MDVDKGDTPGADEVELETKYDHNCNGLHFHKTHPGHECCHLIKLKFEVHPMMFHPKGSLCGVKGLELDNDD